MLKGEKYMTTPKGATKNNITPKKDGKRKSQDISFLFCRLFSFTFFTPFLIGILDNKFRYLPRQKINVCGTGSVAVNRCCKSYLYTILIIKVIAVVKP